MDPSNPDDWRKLATAFTSAPLWAVMVATGVTVGAAVWWFGWEGAKLILEQRLSLAAEQLAVSDRAKNETQNDVQSLKMAIGAKADNASLVALAAQVEAATSRWATANAAVSSTLFAELNVTEAPDVASFTGDNGAHSNPEWEALKKKVAAPIGGMPKPK
jgi:hypothetical protein